MFYIVVSFALYCSIYTAPQVEVHPRSKQATLDGNTRINCYINNAVGYKWQKISTDMDNSALDGVRSNTLWFKQFAATDQGAYQCVGIGGGEYSAMEVRSRPAVLTAEGGISFICNLKLK